MAHAVDFTPSEVGLFLYNEFGSQYNIYYYKKYEKYYRRCEEKQWTRKENKNALLCCSPLFSIVHPTVPLRLSQAAALCCWCALPGGSASSPALATVPGRLRIRSLPIHPDFISVSELTLRHGGRVPRLPCRLVFIASYSILIRNSFFLFPHL